MPGYTITNRKGEAVVTSYVSSPADDLDKIARYVRQYGTGLTIYVADEEANGLLAYHLSDLFDVHFMTDKPALMVRVDGTTEMVSPYDETEY